MAHQPVVHIGCGAGRVFDILPAAVPTMFQEFARHGIEQRAEFHFIDAAGGRMVIHNLAGVGWPAPRMTFNHAAALVSRLVQGA